MLNVTLSMTLEFNILHGIIHLLSVTTLFSPSGEIDD